MDTGERMKTLAGLMSEGCQPAFVLETCIHLSLIKDASSLPAPVKSIPADCKRLRVCDCLHNYTANIAVFGFNACFNKPFHYGTGFYNPIFLSN